MMTRKIGHINECPMVEFAMNSNVSSTTGFAPFELSQGYMPQMGIPTMVDTHFRGVKQLAEQARSNLLAAHDAILVAYCNHSTLIRTVE